MQGMFCFYTEESSQNSCLTPHLSYPTIKNQQQT